MPGWRKYGTTTSAVSWDRRITNCRQVADAASIRVNVGGVGDAVIDALVLTSESGDKSQLYLALNKTLMQTSYVPSNNTTLAVNPWM